MNQCTEYNIYGETEAFKKFLINTGNSIDAFIKTEPNHDSLIRFMEVIKDQSIEKIKQLTHSIQELKS